MKGMLRLAQQEHRGYELSGHSLKTFSQNANAEFSS